MTTRIRKLPRGVSQGLHYHPAKLRPVRGMAKHRTKGHGSPRKQTITLSKVRM
jgi:hypothetical protein